MKANSYCVGVIWYNPDKRAILQLNELVDVFDKIYIYDNSLKSNKTKLKKYLSSKQVVYFFNGKNEGISKAFNRISHYAKKADFLFTLDQDTEVTKKQIIQLQSYINNNFDKNVGIYCPEIIFGKKGTSRKDIVDIDFTITSCSMINLKVFRQLGGYDENIFLDGVDREFCFRLRQANYKIRQISYIKVKQNLGNGRKNVLGVYEHSPIRNYYIAYNRRYFIDKYPTFFRGYLRIKYLHLSTLKQILSIVLCESEKIKKIKSIHKAIKDYKLKNKRK